MKASEHRWAARSALKGNWPWAVLTTLVAGLLGGISWSGGSASAGNNQTENVPITEIEEILGNEQAIGNYVAEYLPLFVGGAVIAIAVGLIFLMLGSVVGLGYRKYTLSLIDREKATFSQLFSQFHRLWQAVLMRLLIGAVEFLPLIAVSLVMVLIPVLGGLLLLVWVIALIYVDYGFALADFVMAENENCTAMEALRRSWMLMDGQRWNHFCLSFSFIGWAILCAFTFGIGGLFLTPYVQVSYASFYRNLVPGTAHAAPTSGYTDYAGVNHEYL